MPVLPRQLRRQVHRLHADKKMHAQADAKRRLQAPLGKEGKPKPKEGKLNEDTKFMKPSMPKDKTGAIASLPDISTRTDPEEAVPDYEGQGYEGHDVGAAQDIPEGKPPTNPYKNKDDEEEEGEESELPPTNPYKTKQ